MIDLRSKKRRLAYEVAKTHCSVEVAFKDLIEKSKKITKREKESTLLF